MVSASEEKAYVVTAASRGLGLGMVEGLLKQENTVVVAAARNPEKAEALQKLASQYKGRVHLVALDTTNEAGIKARTVTAALPWFSYQAYRCWCCSTLHIKASWHLAVNSASMELLFGRLLQSKWTSYCLEALMCW